MTNEQFTELMQELRAIRSALSHPKPSAAPLPAAGSQDVPPPVKPVPNAGEVCVHFGKNTGKALCELSAKSVEWYAQEPAPRLRQDGTPFPPRPADVALREAARTLVHQRRGTIPTPEPVLQSVNMKDDDISF